MVAQFEQELAMVLDTIGDGGEDSVFKAHKVYYALFCKAKRLKKEGYPGLSNTNPIGIVFQPISTKSYHC